MAERHLRVKSTGELYRNMSAIRSVDTKAEVLLRSTLHRLGLRFRKNVLSLPGRPDIVFKSRRLAVFVDGDFWHGRAYRDEGEMWIVRAIHEHARPYWRGKMERRITRDDAVTRDLQSKGWSVLRVWESEVIADAAAAASRIVCELRSELPRRHHRGSQ